MVAICQATRVFSMSDLLICCCSSGEGPISSKRMIVSPTLISSPVLSSVGPMSSFSLRTVPLALPRSIR